VFTTRHYTNPRLPLPLPLPLPAVGLTLRRRAEREWFVCSQAFAVRGEVTRDSGLKLAPLIPEARDLHKTDEEVRNISVE